MSKWLKYYGFPDSPLPPITVTFTECIIKCIDKLFGIKIKKDDRKLITNYAYILRRRFSQIMKDHDYDKIAYYLEIDVPIHFGKSLCVDFVGMTYPIKIIKLLVDKIDGSNKIIIPLIYYCMKNEYIDESIILLDKFSKGLFISKLAYIFDDNEDYFSTILKKIIYDKRYDLLETLGLEFTDSSCERGNDFFRKLSMDCNLFDAPIEDFKDEDLYTLLIKLSIREQYDYTMILLHKYTYPQNILNELLETCAMSENMPSYKDDLKKCVLYLLKKGAIYSHPNLSAIANCYVFGILGAKKFKLQYDISKTAKEFLDTSIITEYYGNHSYVETFLKYLHDIFFTTSVINIYPLIRANWSEMIHFLLNECDPNLKFEYDTKINILKKSCEHDHLQIVNLVLNNNRIGGTSRLTIPHINEAVEITCGKGLMDIMNELSSNNRCRHSMISNSNKLAKLAYYNNKLNMIDLLVTIPEYKLMNIIYSDDCCEFNDMLFKKILIRLWYIWQVADMFILNIDIINVICSIYLQIL